MERDDSDRPAAELGQIPPPRRSADDMVGAGLAAASEIRNLAGQLHALASRSTSERAAHLRAVADVVSACGTDLAADLLSDRVPHALVAAFSTADLPHCLGHDAGA